MDGARRAGTKGIEVRLLGPVEAARDGRPASLGGPKPRTLLTVLALDLGRVVSVDRLVESLWPGDAPETAPHAVQVYVSQLRKALGPVISTRPPGYVLELDPERVDVHRFTRLAEDGSAALLADAPEAAETALREALALWRGPALADFLYEPFAQSEIARLEELRTGVLEERIEADLALGRHAELVPELEALVQAQPHRERPRAQLMLALYRSGRQAEALAAYRAAREALRDELGIEPGPELKELEAAILRQDESLLLEEETSSKPAMQFRRLASILVVDVVESMALTESLDPEALGSVQRRYFETVSAALTRHGGTVEKYAGDAVLAVFGVPITHEDDALRAARAAFDIQTGIRALNDQLERDHDVALEIRIGIAAGEVVATPTDARQRFVAGDVVGVAARLEHAARPGEIVVGEIVARLIDHAARLEPLGDLQVKGRKAPLRTFRLLELIPVAPAFERRLDAPLIGRKRELAALRRQLKAARDTGSARVCVVVGPAGVGKSRLAAELTQRARGVTTLWGRCLSYGDGITYWPLREMLEQATDGDEREVTLAALGADTPPPAPEIAWSFRRFCESLARQRPLVLVLDDLHWAEPTFLDLVEQVAARGEGAILVVCLARDELLVDRPEFLGGEGAERIALESLSADETDALLEGLGGGVLETDQRDRIVEAAEGNPFFLEQLAALGLEGGLAAGALPETVQALLAARLDRLGPGERAVLERGAVIGKAFRLDDVAALLDPEAAPTTELHLGALSARGFVRPEEGGGFAFRHVLLQEAVYRAAPKRLRAELHERFIDRFTERRAGTGDVDEFAGYHLEQAYRLRTELGESDRRTAQLGEDAGRRLGVAGFGALKRGDMSATESLLARATSLLPAGDATRLELMCELGVARHAMGDSEGARAAFADAIAGAEAESHRRIELRARIEAAYGRLLAEPEGATRDLLTVAEAAIPTFEAFEDDRALARAWLLIGYVRGGIHGDHAAWEEAEERALGYYRRTEFPPATCMQQIAAAIYWGPTPVPQGIERLATLLEDDTLGRFGHATVAPFLGGLYAQAGKFATARDLIAEAEHTLIDGFGAATTAVTHCGTVRADVELLGGDLHAAEATLREQCAHFERVHDRAHLAVRAAKLAETLFRQRRWEESQHWVFLSRSCAASDDQSAQLIVGAVEAKLLAVRGAIPEARELAEDMVRLADGTDGLNLIAFTRLALAEVLRAADLHSEARRATLEAIDLFERKGNSVAASEAGDLLDLEVPA